MPISDPFSAAVIFAALFLGGLLKGATGAGAPVIAIPVMAAFFDVKLAVIIMATTNLVTNLWQMREYKSHRMPGRFAFRFALAGGAGALAGTGLLASLAPDTLMTIVACVVVFYIVLRLLMPEFKLEMRIANLLLLPSGFAAGVLQGAAGISAPFSVTFLNAMRLDRPVFIATISVFFTIMSLAQLPALFAYRLMTLQLLVLGAAALVPMFLGMPVGAWLAQRMSTVVFDRVMLFLLSVLAVRLLYVAFS